MVAVAYAAADHPSLIARMAERRQQRDPESAGVVLSAQQVHAPAAAVERLAVPPPDFGLHQPVLHLPVAGEGPRIEIPREVHGPARGESRLQRQIDRRRRIVEQVALDGQPLRVRLRDSAKQHQ